MSATITCQGCHESVEGPEICELCLAPLQTVQPEQTLVVEAPRSSEFGSAPGNSHLQEQFQALKFQPSSALGRSFSVARKVLTATIIGLLLTGAPIFWWYSTQAGKAAEAQAAAVTAFEAGDYEASREAWESACQAYSYILDRDQQAHSLYNIGRCYMQLRQPELALGALEEAERLIASEETSQAIRKCHRLLAVRHLEESKSLYGPDSYGEAYLEAKKALVRFERGEAADYQLAGAHRRPHVAR